MKTTQTSHFDVQRSMFSARCPVFDVQRSTVDVRCSEFDVRGSEFDVRGSEFDVRGSEFDVRGSEFDVQGSEFDVQGSERRLAFSPEGCRKLAGGEASPRAGTTGSSEFEFSPRQGRWKSAHPHLSIAPAGAGSFLLIGSGGSAELHHRLISVTPPAWSQRACVPPILKFEI